MAKQFKMARSHRPKFYVKSLPEYNPQKFRIWADRTEFRCLNAAKIGGWICTERSVSTRGTRFLRFVREDQGVIIRITGYSKLHDTVPPENRFRRSIFVGKIRSIKINISYLQNKQFGFQIEQAIQMLAGNTNRELFDSPIHPTQTQLANMAYELNNSRARVSEQNRNRKFPAIDSVKEVPAIPVPSGDAKAVSQFSPQSSIRKTPTFEREGDVGECDCGVLVRLKSSGRFLKAYDAHPPFLPHECEPKSARESVSKQRTKKRKRKFANLSLKRRIFYQPGVKSSKY